MDANRAITALLVDDDPGSLRANQSRLEAEGYTVLASQSESEALFQARRSAPNVIFVHLVKTDGGSLSLIQALRSDDGCRHIPVHLTSGLADRRVSGAMLHAVPREG